MSEVVFRPTTCPCCAARGNLFLVVVQKKKIVVLCERRAPLARSICMRAMQCDITLFHGRGAVALCSFAWVGVPFGSFRGKRVCAVMRLATEPSGDLRGWCVLRVGVVPLHLVSRVAFVAAHRVARRVCVVQPGFACTTLIQRTRATPTHRDFRTPMIADTRTFHTVSTPPPAPLSTHAVALSGMLANAAKCAFLSRGPP